MTTKLTMHARRTWTATHSASPLGPFAFRSIAFVVAWIVGLGAVPALSPRATADEMGSPVPAEEAAATMKLPPGFKATPFAAEPDLTQPIAFTFDDRGRIWVVESLSYPTWKADGTGSDRVTIFEDTDGDGRHDKRTVFYDRGVNLSGIEVGFGGVWLTAVPNLIFIPDANGDDRPDGPPKVLLDGWDLKAKHNVVCNLAWGPDGWLYGCNGILSNSLVGKPGTAERDRVAINCGVWRYHPTRHAFEAFAHGTTNPWGIDWDERGEMFITNCVIKHAFHFLPGGHYERMFGEDLNKYTYGLLASCADHQHWAGGHWTTSRGGEGAHGDAGGGHAHSGCMIYLGENWPAEYRGNLMTLNIHGQRLNRDTLHREGSGYVARHAADLAFAQDPWFRGVGVKYGPDGGVFISDWSDIGECHDYTEEDCDRRSGRIFKIVYEQGPLPPAEDLTKRDSDALLSLVGNSNEWQSRHARRILQERAFQRKIPAASLTQARKELSALSLKLPTLGAPSRRALALLWTLHAAGAIDETLLVDLLSAGDETLRAQAVKLASEPRKVSDAVAAALAKLAASEASPLVRVHLVAAVQRLPLDQKWPLGEALVSQSVDPHDANLPLMLWYAVEPLAAADPRRAIGLLPEVQIPLVRQLLTRRIVAVHEGEGQPNPSNAWIMDKLLKTLATADDAVRRDILLGLQQTYRGRREMPAPRDLTAFAAELALSDNPEVRDLASELSVLYGDAREIARLEEIVMKRERATAAERRRALELLVARRDPSFGQSVLMLLRDPEIRPDAIRALAAFDRPETAQRLVTLYPEFSPTERQDAIQTLTARPALGLALLDAIEAGTIPRADVSALVIRQLQALENDELNQRLTAVWGEIRPPSAEKRERIAAFKEQLDSESLKLANLSRGRAIYAKTCANCHRLFGTGGLVGPELTGAQRTSLDYVLDNVLDPSAIVPREYRPHVLRLADGRVVQGVVVEETPQTLVVQTANETLRVPTGEIENRRESALSMMPEGLFDRLSAEEIRDLVGYLASPEQVPLAE
jgi:putative membrane-bound dehydrogenase-like protein